MDALLNELSKTATILLPIAGVVCLIILAMILYQVLKVVKNLPTTIEKVDQVLDSTQSSVDQLQEPLSTITNVSRTVDMVNDSAVGAVSTVASFAMKHSDAVVNWFADTVDKKQSARAKRKNGNEDVEMDVDVEMETKTEKEEDFGIYE
ncbi:hypothetical protein H9L01_07545 [Erysipelothrix inopinata]|uniref:DUF948 domain-containing protein n=1 Tax=Erysipelothrix inopinata TaxID=225084 RepID=A0A7G9RX93_9FIRM|nr:hypothetical protein [Erysipelothrix inopinata]QNN60218.1 hypothetical protein H9L01_07545 [Erysipelothrix inopinata]